MKRAAHGDRPSSLAHASSALADGRASGGLDPAWLRLTPDGCVLELALLPNARCNAWAGLHDGALRLRLLAPPVDGAANHALMRWLADEFGVRLSQVALLSGATSRRKRVAVQCTPAQRQHWLGTLPPEVR
jgi:uncharacterized protein (TIGR00251 family)